MTVTPAQSAAPVRNTGRPIAFLVLACLMFAGQGVAIKFVGRQLGPIQVAFMALGVATVLMLPLLVRARISNPNAPKLTRGDLGRFLIAGIGGQVVAQFCMVWGVMKSLASNAAILGLLLPVISVVLASLMLRECITRLRVFAVVIGLVGVLLLSAGSMGQSSFWEMRYLTGNLLILAGISGSAFYNVYCKGLFGRFQQIEVLAYSYIAASLVGVPLLLWASPLRSGALGKLHWPSWVALGYLAFVVYGVAMLLFFSALERVDVTIASLSLYLLPVFGVILAALILGERLGWLALFGGAIVLISTILILRYDQVETAYDAATQP